MGSAIHRGAGQIIPTMRRVTYAACLLATPAIQEPVYLVELQCLGSQARIAVISCIHQRDGQVISEQQQLETGAFTVKAHLPVSKSFGFDAELHSRTAGKVSTYTVFDHWETLPGCPLDKGSIVEELVMGIRRQKGLKPEIPPLETFCDKL
jgi:elongation factor 2